MSERGTEFRHLWDLLWAGGVADPLTALEQISYLLYLRWIELADDEHRSALQRGEANHLPRLAEKDERRWSRLLKMRPARTLEIVKEEAFPLLTRWGGGSDFSEAMRDARFGIPGAELLRDTMEAIDELPFDLARAGDLYERMLDELARDDRSGSPRTPRALVDAMLQVVDVQPGDVVWDPAAGTAEFLVAARQALLRADAPPRDGQLFGRDDDPRMVRIGGLNLIFHGVKNPLVRWSDSLAAPHKAASADVVLSTPPFGSRSEDRDVHPALRLGSKRTELMFVELCRRLLNPGGRCAIVVPAGLLAHTSGVHVTIRRRLVQNACLRAVIGLPSGVFSPYASVKTAVLVFEGGAGTDQVLFFEAGAEWQRDLLHVPEIVARHTVDPHAGWSSPEIAAAVREQAWTARVREIADNDFELVPNAYRPRPVDEGGRVDLGALLEEVMRLEEQFGDRLGALHTLLSAPR